MKIEIINNKQYFYQRFIGPYGPKNRENMEKFKHHIMAQNLMNDNVVIVAMALDNPQETNPSLCRYDIGITDVDKESIPGLNAGVLKTGKYAVVELIHTEKAINDFWYNLPQFLMDHDLKYDDSRIIIERYQQTFIVQNLCEILIPIK